MRISFGTTVFQRLALLLVLAAVALIATQGRRVSESGRDTDVMTGQAPTGDPDQEEEGGAVRRAGWYYLQRAYPLSAVPVGARAPSRK